MRMMQISDNFVAYFLGVYIVSKINLYIFAM